MCGVTELCQCSEPGPCQRYGRDMRGRMWEVCRGINVDLGTSASFRAEWDREVRARLGPTSKPRRLLLISDHAPGDNVAMTAAVYSLHEQYPGQYETVVATPHPRVWDHNPHASNTLRGFAGWEPLHMHYPAVHRSNDRAIHFMQAWCEHLGAALGVEVPLLTDRPRLYFPPGPEPRRGDYWVVCAGGKSDFTAKRWGGYQAVVDRLRGAARFVQVGAAGDDHPQLRGDNVLDRVGRTSLRQLFDLVRGARGVLCGVSLLMHVAAALDRPAIIIAGGREPVAWNAYPRQHYVHTVGALPCRSTQGHIGRACWRSRTVPLGDGSAWDRDPCERPKGGLPECMQLIHPAAVAELVLRYNQVS